MYYLSNDVFIIDAVLDSQFDMNGTKYDCIPKNVNLALFLEDYYNDMVEAGKVEDD